LGGYEDSSEHPLITGGGARSRIGSTAGSFASIRSRRNGAGSFAHAPNALTAQPSQEPQSPQRRVARPDVINSKSTRLVQVFTEEQQRRALATRLLVAQQSYEAAAAAQKSGRVGRAGFISCPASSNQVEAAMQAARQAGALGPPKPSEVEGGSAALADLDAEKSVHDMRVRVYQAGTAPAMRTRSDRKV
jgi:hypothetical protein